MWERVLLSAASQGTVVLALLALGVGGRTASADGIETHPATPRIVLDFLERLRALTNLRVVPDEVSSSGYRIDVAPFPGWQKVPLWF